MIVRSADVELRKLKANGTLVIYFKEGINALKASGIFNLLRMFARPFTTDRGANPYTAAYTAAYAEGYNDALDDLIYFEEKYLVDEVKQKQVSASFGGLNLALKKGDLTVEESNKLKGGKNGTRTSS